MPFKRRKISRDERCANCLKLVRYETGQLKIVSSASEAEELTDLLQREIKETDVFCEKCRYLLYKQKTEKLMDESSISIAQSDESVGSTAQDALESNVIEQQSSQLSYLSLTSDSSSQSSQLNNDPFFIVPEKPEQEFIDMPFNRVISTHRYCCVCYAEPESMVVVPFKARIQVFIMTRIFIPKNNRCCASHLINHRFFLDDINKLHVHANSCSIDKEEIKLFMNELSTQCRASTLNKFGDGDLSQEQIKSLTGYTIEEINVLKNMLTSMRNTENRSINEALFIFLFKFRTGSSNNIISSLFDIKLGQNVSDYCESVLNSFQKDVLPLHFGAQVYSREDLILHHTSPYVKKLHGYENRLILIADGTYLRHEKSSNNYYQRHSYSGQKKNHLCKPFTVCTTDGFIIDTYGPFVGTMNDAEIMKVILSDPNGLKLLLKKGDVFIVDRGFRDIKVHLESEGFIVLMPALKGHRKHLTTAEANESRFVTKLRWVVEAIHGIISSKFKLLHNQLDNKLLPNATAYCKIASFLVNLFGKRLNYDSGIQDEIAEHMLLQKNIENSLAIEVEENNWNRKKKTFKQLRASDVKEFPELTETDLKILFTGSYQLSQAVSYLAELYTEDGEIHVNHLVEDNTILKCEVRSRHINRKMYKCYLHYEPNSIGYAGIKRYVCDCANGLRSVGCCSHIAAIIYFLGHARYLSRIFRPAEILTNLFKVDKTNPVINEDSDDD